MEYVRQKAQEGWSLVAVEWERDTDGEIIDAGMLKQEIPFGLRVSTDCLHLEENPTEKAALTLMLEGIVEDRSLSEVTDAMNKAGMLTRQGKGWTQSDVFFMLPRLIDSAPQIFSSEEWKQRRLDVVAGIEKLMRS
jgi:hypothetical protein